MGKWKAYRGMNESADDAVELYDLSLDEEEQIDLAGEEKFAEVLKAAKTIMNRESAGTACKFIPLALQLSFGKYLFEYALFESF